MLDDAAVAEILAASEGSEEACRRLVDGALDMGGEDNVTVVLARYTIPDLESDD
jgi:serine/threonine protein phosphatase PrpC